MLNVATVTKQTIARPLKVLVPLIKVEIATGDRAGLEHYRRAGELLIEAKDQVPWGSWSRWLKTNFELSQRTASRYMQLARIDEDGIKTASQGQTGLYQAIGEKRGRSAWKSVHPSAYGRVFELVRLARRH
jgi:hypothetical protein